MQPGRARQQPQRRARLGPVPDLLRRRRPVGRPHRRPRRRSTPRCGASASSSPAACRTGSAASRSSPAACSPRPSAIAWIAADHRLRGRGRSARVLLGAGTAMVYPTLLAAIGDVAHPALAGPRRRRLPAVARRRLRRRRAARAGILADLLGLAAAIWASPRSPPRPGSSWRCACTRPTAESSSAAILSPWRADRKMTRPPPAILRPHSSVCRPQHPGLPSASCPSRGA